MSECCSIQETRHLTRACFGLDHPDNGLEIPESGGVHVSTGGSNLEQLADVVRLANADSENADAIPADRLGWTCHAVGRPSSVQYDENTLASSARPPEERPASEPQRRACSGSPP